MERQLQRHWLVFVLLMFLLIVSVSAALPALDEATPTPWSPARLASPTTMPTLTPGWWERMPTPLPWRSAP